MHLGEDAVGHILIMFWIDFITGKSRGIGFVIMPDPQAAQNAINALDGKIIKGNRVMVNETLSKNKLARRKFL